jgi:parallel beta-helix repeat protein
MATYYVATTGSNSNSGSISSPWLTIKFAVSQLTAGDTLYIRGGTYTGTNNTINSQTGTVPSGTSTSPVTICGFTGETVILKPDDQVTPIKLTTGGPHYLTFQDFIIDGSNFTVFVNGEDLVYLSSGAHHNRFLNLEVKSGACNGYHFSESGGSTDYNEIIGGSSHNNGTFNGGNSGYGMYISSSYNLIKGVDIYGNNGYGIQQYSGAGNGIQNQFIGNKIHGNFVTGTPGVGGTSSYGISVMYGSDTLIANNVIYGNQGGILVYSGSQGVKVYNNTVVYNVGHAGGGEYGIQTQFFTTPPIIKNNIVYGNSVGAFKDDSDHANGVPVYVNNLETNPTFTNVSTNDYSIQSTSAARDAGLTLSEVTTDILLTPRPQGTAYDIGAYEYSGSGGGGGANTYYVAPATASPAGSNSNTGSITSPWLTIAFAVAQMVAGDTLYIRGGTYTGSSNVIDSNSSGAVPSGTSSALVTIAGYPGESVTIQPPAGTAGVRYVTNPKSYIVVQDIVIDMVNSTTSGGQSGVYVASTSIHNKFIRVEVKNNSGSGFETATTSSFTEFTGCSSHNNGTVTQDSGNGFVIQSPDTLIDGCQVYANTAYGIYAYGTSWFMRPGDDQEVPRLRERHERRRWLWHHGRRGR